MRDVSARLYVTMAQKTADKIREDIERCFIRVGPGAFSPKAIKEVPADQINEILARMSSETESDDPEN